MVGAWCMGTILEMNLTSKGAESVGYCTKILRFHKAKLRNIALQLYGDIYDDKYF